MSDDLREFIELVRALREAERRAAKDHTYADRRAVTDYRRRVDEWLERDAKPKLAL